MDLDHERLDVYHLALDFLVLASEIIEGVPRGRSHLDLGAPRDRPATAQQCFPRRHTDSRCRGHARASLAGGGGSDTFHWDAGDLTGGALDYIADFEKGIAGDILDLSDLLEGLTNKESHVRIAYSAGTHLLSDAAPPPAV